MEIQSRNTESQKHWTRFGVFWLAIATAYIAVAFYGYAHPKQLSDAQKIYGLSTMWMKSAQFYAHWELLPDLNWDSAYQEYISKVLATENDRDYYDVLEEFFALMHDGHAGVFYPSRLSRMQKNGLPIEVSYLEEKYYVVAVDDRLSKIPLGSVITAIDAMNTHEYMEQLVGHRVGMHTPYARENQLAHYFNFFYPPDQISVAVIEPSGEHYQETIESNSKSRNNRLNTEILTGKAILTTKTLNVYDHENGIYQVSIPAFDSDGLELDFDRFVHEYGDTAKGFVIDIRGNVGGSTLVGLPVLHHFISPSELAASMEGERFYQRVDNVASIMAAAYNWSDHEDYPDGVDMLKYRYYQQEPDQIEMYVDMAEKDILEQPVVVLVDWNCVSAGDHVAAFVKFSDRFLLMGTHTAGATGNLASFELPDGGRFGITVYRGLQPDGSDYFNRGVQPDMWTEQTITDVLQQVDRPLMQALSHINEEINSM